MSPTPSSLRATCDSCGKVYRVPSADRSYACKVCDGTVAVAAPRSRPEQEPEPKPKPKPKPKSEPPARAARPSARRRQAQQSARRGWLALAVFLAVVGLGYGAYASGLVAWAAGAEPNLAVVTGKFIDDWEDGDIDDMVGFHHPDQRDDFDAKLRNIARNRGWQDGFPEVTQRASVESAGDFLDGLGEGEQSRRGASRLTCADAEVEISWQFMPSRKRWVIYGLFVTPPALQPRVDGFRDAWARSNAGALRPFFLPDSEDKMAALVDRKAREGGWAESFPTLGNDYTDGERAARSLSARFGTGRAVETTYDCDPGDLTVRWGFVPKLDQWFVRGFSFP